MYLQLMSKNIYHCTKAAVETITSETDWRSVQPLLGENTGSLSDTVNYFVSSAAKIDDFFDWCIHKRDI